MYCVLPVDLLPVSIAVPRNNRKGFQAIPHKYPTQFSRTRTMLPPWTTLPHWMILPHLPSLQVYSHAIAAKLFSKHLPQHSAAQQIVAQADLNTN